MAPALKSSRAFQGKKQPDVRSFFGKITKAAAASHDAKNAPKKVDHRLSYTTEGATLPRSIAKRKHAELEGNEHCELQASCPHGIRAKKVCLMMGNPFCLTL